MVWRVLRNGPPTTVLAKVSPAMTSRNTCNICKVHYPLSWVPEIHYATRAIHPKCDRCGSLFRDKEEFGWVGVTFQLVMLYQCFYSIASIVPRTLADHRIIPDPCR